MRRNMGGTFLKYIAVGVMNTALTTIIILLLISSGTGLYISNFTGYVAGIILSFFMNSLFTFNSKVSKGNAVRFLLVCVICYIFNLVAIKFAFGWITKNVYVVQLFGIVTYTVTGYLLNKKWAMR